MGFIESQESVQPHSYDFLQFVALCLFLCFDFYYSINGSAKRIVLLVKIKRFFLFILFFFNLHSIKIIALIFPLHNLSDEFVLLS